MRPKVDSPSVSPNFWSMHAALPVPTPTHAHDT